MRVDRALVKDRRLVAAMVIVDSCQNPLSNGTLTVDCPEATGEMVCDKRDFPVIVFKACRPDHGVSFTAVDGDVDQATVRALNACHDRDLQRLKQRRVRHPVVDHARDRWLIGVKAFLCVVLSTCVAC